MHRPQGATSSTFAQGYGGQASKSSLVFGEDVPASLHYAVARKKRLRLLSEELLLAQKREEKTYVFVRHPSNLNGILSLKTQNFPVKSNSENRFTFIQKSSESFLPSQIPVYQRQPRDV